MGFSESLQIGDTVPVLLPLDDGATDQYPQAEIRDNTGILLTTLDLSHVANGLYAPSSAYIMPDRTFIDVLYIVYLDASHLIENALYSQRDHDIFYKIDPDDYKADVSALSLEATAQDILADTNDLQSNQSDWLTATGFATQNPPSQNLDDYKADVSGIDFLRKIVKNRRILQKNGSTWEMTVYDDDDSTPILNKELKDKSGNDITDLEAGVLARELKTTV